MVKAAALARRAAVETAVVARIAIVLGCAGALILAERAFPLF
jgi:hypothetical protein